MAHVYISGPMTGLPLHNAPAFAAAELHLITLGHTVINPATTGAIDTQHIDAPRWVDYMVAALRRLESATAICMLPGWESSPGARIERIAAERRGLPVWGLP